MRKRLSVCTPVCPTCGRPHAGPRCERGVAHALARAAPAGTRGGAGGEEPRTRGALAHAECQMKRTMAFRSPKLTGAFHAGMHRVWFLLQHGQLHRRLPTAASAARSPDVLALRGTPGELGESGELGELG